MLKSGLCYFTSNQWQMYCLSNRGETIGIGHFKEIEIGFMNRIFPPPIPIPGVATKLLPTAQFIFKDSLDDAPRFLFES